MRAAAAEARTAVDGGDEGGRGGGSVREQRGRMSSGESVGERGRKKKGEIGDEGGVVTGERRGMRGKVGGGDGGAAGGDEGGYGSCRNGDGGWGGRRAQLHDVIRVLGLSSI
ncbi:uncharacterized protein LOC107484018 [Arachis duranensis]|uniref:Uncharacterized protein LOC107484018 n=1 Tax=Arachis duranensis TaxID=130453 RepID=A0A6P4D2Z1_ARADU|nr:uncharacterized protein LOC107484018 [Arachis duranensis]